MSFGTVPEEHVRHNNPCIQSFRDDIGSLLGLWKVSKAGFEVVTIKVKGSGRLYVHIKDR